MASFLRRWKKPLIKTKILSGVAKYGWYLRSMHRYSKMEGAEPIRLRDTYPRLFDDKPKTSVNTQYFYQDVWAFRKIYSFKPDTHVDVGSNVIWVSLLTAITKVHFVDIRPLDAPDLDNIECITGSVLEMPYPDNSLKSLSCLNVAEHVGLGRYGDPLDPLGTKKAAEELARCLAKGGNLLFSLPVGKPRVCFNAHRVHSPSKIVEYFGNLKLVEFSGADDKNRWRRNIEVSSLENAKLACGMFHFTKE